MEKMSARVKISLNLTVSGPLLQSFRTNNDYHLNFMSIVACA